MPRLITYVLGIILIGPLSVFLGWVVDEILGFSYQQAGSFSFLILFVLLFIWGLYGVFFRKSFEKEIQSTYGVLQLQLLSWFFLIGSVIALVLIAVS